MGPIDRYMPLGTSVTPPQTEDKRTRCFVTSVAVENPDFNRLMSRVHFKADHAYGNGFEGSIHVLDGSQYRIGDVIWIEIS